MANNSKKLFFQLFDTMDKETCDQLIKKQQREKDSELYEKKSPNDRLVCVICGGKYIRHSRAKHVKTNKHQTKLNEFYAISAK